VTNLSLFNEEVKFQAEKSTAQADATPSPFLCTRPQDNSFNTNAWIRSVTGFAISINGQTSCV